ncbi:MAG: peptidoglycan DD-metalloendopeptidase family protein [Desulfobacterales bacterium]|jgi:septal ring factor EnvC (AmiA/AmiB activator)|nr:peptidoglycan DD-metalloendopeptidase family protein [Desulfobacterales bacterium]
MLSVIKTVSKIGAVALLVFVFIGRPPAVFAEEADALSQKARNLDTQLKKKQSEATAFTRRETELIDNLNKIDSNLNNLEKKAATLEKKQAILAAALKENEAVADALESEVANLETYASKRLVALYKLSRLGSLPLLASAESLFELLAKKKSIQILLAYDESVWKTLSNKKIALAGVREALVSQRQTHKQQEAELEEQMKRLTRHRTEREHLLTQIKEKKSLAMAAITALKTAARELEDQINAAALNQKPELATVRPFESLKGLLKMPVKGTIVQFFGPYTLSPLNVTGFRSGIDIQAEKGEPIQAVNHGKTLYAGWFKGYGNMVILDHGNNYCTVYAHAQEIFKQKGDRVAAGEVIATVGDTGSLQGSTVHFEIRHHGKPVDPLKWIEERSRKTYDKTANR